MCARSSRARLITPIEAIVVQFGQHEKVSRVSEETLHNVISGLDLEGVELRWHIEIGGPCISCVALASLNIVRGRRAQPLNALNRPSSTNSCEVPSVAKDGLEMGADMEARCPFRGTALISHVATAPTALLAGVRGGCAGCRSVVLHRQLHLILATKSLARSPGATWDKEAAKSHGDWKIYI